MLVVGWALGILSSPITDAIRRRSVKQRITRAVRTELYALQDALALVVLQVARRRGELSYSLMEALMSSLRTSGQQAGTSRALKLIQELLAAELPAPTTPVDVMSPRMPIPLRVPGVPFLIAHLHRLDFYSHQTQRQMLEIRTGTQAFEQLADEAMRYHFLMFGEGVGREHLDALQSNVETCYQRAADKASELVSQVASLLREREMSVR